MIINETIKKNAMKTQVKQIKNNNGTFQYLVNGVVYKKSSKKDYNYFLCEIGSFSNSIDSLNSIKSWYSQYGIDTLNRDNMVIVKIEK